MKPSERREAKYIILALINAGCIDGKVILGVIVDGVSFVAIGDDSKFTCRDA